MMRLMFLSFSLAFCDILFQIFLSITGGSNDMALFRGSDWSTVFLSGWDRVFFLNILVGKDPISPVAIHVLGLGSSKRFSISLSFSWVLTLSFSPDILDRF